MSKLYKNWPFHSLVAYPISELAYWAVRPFSKLCAEKFSKMIHDSTLPEEKKVKEIAVEVNGTYSEKMQDELEPIGGVSPDWTFHTTDDDCEFEEA